MRIQIPRPISPMLCFGIAKSAFEEIAGSGQMIRPYRVHWIGFVAGVTVVQYLVVRLGLEMAIAHGNVSPVWPATGFAIAVLLRWGVHLWPGIALGSFLGLAQTGVAIPMVIAEPGPMAEAENGSTGRASECGRDAVGPINHHQASHGYRPESREHSWDAAGDCQNPHVRRLIQNWQHCPLPIHSSQGL